MPPAIPTKLLLATDLSARCDRALDRAAALAAAWQAELIAVHALERGEDFDTEALLDRVPGWRPGDDGARIAEAQLRQDLALAAEARVSAVVVPADPVELVLQVANGTGCGLIVTGIARDETLGRFGIGNTVEQLLRRSTVPLLIVKQRPRAPYGTIMVATDYAAAARQALIATLGLFPGQPLTLLHVYDAPMAGLSSDIVDFRQQHREAALRDGAAFMAETGMAETGMAEAGMAEASGQQPKIHLVAEYGQPGPVITQYARQHGADLLVIGTSNRNSLLEILLGSTARHVLSHMPCDVLVVPTRPVG